MLGYLKGVASVNIYILLILNPICHLQEKEKELFVEYKRVTTAARELGVNRPMIYYLHFMGRLTRVFIDNKPYIVVDELYKDQINNVQKST